MYIYLYHGIFKITIFSHRACIRLDLSSCPGIVLSVLLQSQRRNVDSSLKRRNSELGSQKANYAYGPIALCGQGWGRLGLALGIGMGCGWCCGLDVCVCL